MSQFPKPSTLALDTLEQLFVKANNDLNYVERKLEAEFNGRQPGQVDPFKLLERIRKIQNELPLVENECRKLLAAKQELIDKTKDILIPNRALLRRLQARAGEPICCDEDDAVFSSFMKVLHEWNNQMQSGGADATEIEDLNQKLLSSIIQGC